MKDPGSCRCRCCCRCCCRCRWLLPLPLPLLLLLLLLFWQFVIPQRGGRNLLLHPQAHPEKSPNPAPASPQQRQNLFPPRHRRRRPRPRHRNPRRSASKISPPPAPTTPHSTPPQTRHAKPPIARPSSIQHGPRIKRPHQHRRLTLDAHQRLLHPQRHNHALRTAPHQHPRRRRRLCLRLHRQPSQQETASLSFGIKKSASPKTSSLKALRRRRIQNRPHTRLARHPQTALHGIQRQLQLCQQNPRRPNRLPLAASTSFGRNVKQAPGTTIIAFSPRTSSIMITADPVAISQFSTSDASIPSADHVSRASLPNASSPSRESICTSAPARAAATAWFDPLPPGPSANPLPISVSPQPGSRAARNATSATKLPSTRIFFAILFVSPPHPAYARAINTSASK